MAQIDKWKCDICGNTFEKDDPGYKNRESLIINISMGQFEGNKLIYYEDVCLNCRKKIYRLKLCMAKANRF